MYATVRGSWLSSGPFFTFLRSIFPHENSRLMVDKELLQKFLSNISKDEARLVLEVLCQEHDLADETTTRQNLFIAHYLDSNCDHVMACRKVGVPQSTWKLWQQDPAFVARLNFSEQTMTSKLMKLALDKAQNGSEAMIKLLLEAFAPDKFDSKYRSSRLIANAQVEAAMQGAKTFTREDIRRLISEDPAQEFVEDEPIH